MKRIAILAVLSIFVFSATAFAANTFLNMGTAGVAGLYYPVGAAMCKIWNTHIPGMKANVQATGGTVQNIQLMGKGEAELAFTDGSYYDAYNGKGAYEGRPQKYMRALVPVYPEPVNFTVAKGGGIKDIAGLKGKRVAVGAVGSGSEVIARAILKAGGLDPDKDIEIHNLSAAEAARAYSDRQIDANIIAGPVGTAGIVEATTMGLAELVDIPEAIVKNISETYPYYIPFAIPAKSYKGQEQSVNVVASWNIISINENVDADLVYRMTKLLYENKKDITNVTARLEAMDLNNLGQITIPFHPGAEKYYKEAGALK
ncbi:C4-dicarboxylate ABC transporter [Deltaproteobacteria bacterium]|nr:C4-dicarboxylate ABC transporter [Deltaproteobacteria bacterium]